MARASKLETLKLKLKSVKHLIATQRLAMLKKKGSSNFLFAMMLEVLPCCNTICMDKKRKRIGIRVRD